METLEGAVWSGGEGFFHKEHFSSEGLVSAAIFRDPSRKTLAYGCFHRVPDLSRMTGKQMSTCITVY